MVFDVHLLFVKVAWHFYVVMGLGIFSLVAPVRIFIFCHGFWICNVIAFSSYFRFMKELLSDLQDLILTMQSPHFEQVADKWEKKRKALFIRISELSSEERKVLDIEYQGWYNDQVADKVTEQQKAISNIAQF